MFAMPPVDEQQAVMQSAAHCAQARAQPKGLCVAASGDRHKLSTIKVDFAAWKILCPF
jgi:hypothetical protein